MHSLFNKLNWASEEYLQILPVSVQSLSYDRGLIDDFMYIADEVFKKSHKRSISVIQILELLF